MWMKLQAQPRVISTITDNRNAMISTANPSSNLSWLYLFSFQLELFTTMRSQVVPLLCAFFIFISGSSLASSILFALLWFTSSVKLTHLWSIFTLSPGYGNLYHAKLYSTFISPFPYRLLTFAAFLHRPPFASLQIPFLHLSHTNVVMPSMCQIEYI